MAEVDLSSTPLRAISLFSGAGGMDVGVMGAGFRLLACIEKDRHCCDTLRANASESGPPLIVEGDIREVDPAALMSDLDLDAGDLDLLCGGPPCQSFSQIGKQGGLDDERGPLLFEMVRFAAELKPKALMIEQVKGLRTARDTRGRRGGILDDLLADIAGLGYSVDWQVLNAADYGVPQTRERLFIVATQPDCGFSFPEPTHRNPDVVDDLPSGREPYVTLTDVLADLASPPRKNGSIPADSHVDITPAGDQYRIHGVPEGKWLSGQLHLPAKQRGKLSRKDTTKFRRLDRGRPSLTLRCGEIFFHPTVDRYLTPREYLRLHGYPSDYVLHGPIRGRTGQVRDLDQHRQVANSVPPPLAHALAERLASCLAWGRSSRSLAFR